MEKIQFTDYQLVSTGKVNFSLPTDTTDKEPQANVYTQDFDNDHLFKQLSDLVNETWRGWYMKRFYALGTQRVLQIASIARTDGKNPAKLFSKMLKDA